MFKVEHINCIPFAVMTTPVCSIKSLYYRPNTDRSFSKNRPKFERHSKESKADNRGTMSYTIAQSAYLT